MTTNELEQEQLLEQLTQWTTGKAFEGESREDVKKQHIQHYGAFVRNHLRIDWPEVSTETDASEMVCAICRSNSLEFPMLVLGEDPSAGDFCRSPGECCFTRWGLPSPHVAHRECYMAGYLDSLLKMNGMMDSQGMVRQQPSWIEAGQLLKKFELREVMGVTVCCLKDQPTTCLFCESKGLSDQTLKNMRDIGFRAKDDSPVKMLSLQGSGSFSPFPVGGTIILRPCFSRQQTATILEHAVVGTFIDFGGYRAKDLCVVMGGGERKWLQRLEESEDSYGVVPAEVVKMHGVLKLVHWPPQLVPTLQNLYLPGSKRRDFYSPNDGSPYLDGHTGAPDKKKTLPPLTPSDPLHQVLLSQKLWVEALPVSAQDSPVPVIPYSNQLSDSDAENARRDWKAAVSNGIQQELDKLATPTSRISARRLRGCVSSLFAPRLERLIGSAAADFSVTNNFRQLWEDQSLPNWKDSAKNAFAIYARPLLEFVPEEHLSQTVQVTLQENAPPGIRRQHSTGPHDAVVVPSSKCCEMGYSYLYRVLGLAPPRTDTMYALELADPAHACQKYIVVDPSAIDPERNTGGLYLSHNYKLSENDKRRLEEIEAAALAVLQNAAETTQTNLDTVDLDNNDDFCKAVNAGRKKCETLRDMTLPICSACGVALPSSMTLSALDHAKARVWSFKATKRATRGLRGFGALS